MYLIVAHHMVNHNSFDFLGQDNSFRKVILSLFEYIPGKIGIALFFIASAWFLSSGNQSLKKSCRKIWKLERAIVFWSLTALILQYHLDPGTIHLQQIISALFPTVTQLWWYTTCYVLFLIFLPFLNLSFKKIGQHDHKILAFVMIMVWGASSLIPYEALNIGLNIIGFIYVYTLITYYRWYMQPLSTKTALIIATACTLLLLAWNVSFELLYTDKHAGEYQALMYIMDREWSLPILGLSLGMFIIFSRMQFRSRIINTIASWTLGVYLITDHSYIRDLLWTQWFAFDKYYQSHFPVVIMLAISMLVFTAGLALEAVRKMMFQLIPMGDGVFNWLWNRCRLFVAHSTGQNDSSLD